MQIEKKAIFLTATLNDCSNQKKKKKTHLKGQRKEGEIWESMASKLWLQS